MKEDEMPKGYHPLFLNIDPTPAPPLNGRGTGLNNVLTLGKAKKAGFLLHLCSLMRTFMSLRAMKILTLGNSQINLEFRSLNRIFAPGI